jgi:GWxTD domain-containing protein
MNHKLDFTTGFSRILNVFVLVVVCSCSGIFDGADLRNRAIANQKMNIEQRIYHFSADSSTLFFKVNTSNLLYARTSKNNGFFAQLLVEIKVLDLKTNNELYLDSTLYTDNDQDKENNLLFGQINIPVGSQQELEVRCRYTDLNRNQDEIFKQRIIKTGKTLENSTLLILPNGLPLISRVNESTGTFSFKSNSNASMKVRKFSGISLLPAPPSERGVETMGEVNFELLPASNQIILDTNNPGLYKIGNSDNLSEHFTFLHRPKGFPVPNDFQELNLATSYFQNSEEVQLLLKNSNQREAFENFWLKKCGTKDKAKNTMQIYYERMELANIHFTTYTDGWKTDRGMIFMIMGPPTRVFNQRNSEIWTYGRDNNVNNLNFAFDKKYSDKIGVHYQLERHSGYRQVWSIAVNTWRAGRVFRF